MQVELQRKGFQAWYRNPSRPSQDSLGVAYAETHEPLAKLLRVGTWSVDLPLLDDNNPY